jgi:hypothetical protein
MRVEALDGLRVARVWISTPIADRDKATEDRQES